MQKELITQKLEELPLLGVNGIVIICHGSSKVHTIRNAIKHAQECAEQKLNEKISLEVSENLEVINQAKALLKKCDDAFGTLY